MSRLFKRGKIYYFEFQGERISTRLTDARAAELWRKEWERRRADPAYAAAHQTTLTSCLKERKVERAQAGRSPHTIKRIGEHAGHIVRILGDGTPIARLDYALVQHYITTREGEGAAQATVAKELSTLRGSLRLAKKGKLFSADLDAIFPEDYSAASTPGTRHLLLDDVWRLVEYLEEPRGALVAFIVATGADLGSAIVAQPGDVCFGSAGELTRVVVRGTKTEYRHRTLPVPWPEFEALLTLADRHLPFRPWGNIRRDLAVACRALNEARKAEHKRLKLPGEPAEFCRVSPRDLRRSTGKILRNEFGVPPSLIAPYLGHADARMVERVYGTIEVDALGEQLAGYGK